jgi:hypothetical protein
MKEGKPIYKIATKTEAIFKYKKFLNTNKEECIFIPNSLN